MQQFVWKFGIVIALLGLIPTILAEDSPDQDTVAILEPEGVFGAKNNVEIKWSKNPLPLKEILANQRATLKDGDRFLEPTRQQLITIHEAIAFVDDKSILDCIIDLIPGLGLPDEPGKLNYKDMSSDRLIRELVKTRSKFRSEVGSTLLIGKSWLRPENQAGYMEVSVKTAYSKLLKLRRNLQKEVKEALETDRQACTTDAMVLGNAVGQLDVAYIEYMALSEFYGSAVGPLKIRAAGPAGPSGVNSNPEARWRGQKANYIIYALGNLADRIVRVQPARRFQSDIPLAIRESLLTAEREFAIREYELAAANARLYNLASFRPITGQPRRQIEWAIRKNLVDYLNARAKDATPILQLFSFSLMMDPTDPRAHLAKQLDATLDNDLDLRRAMLVNIGLDPKPREFFLASALTLRLHNSELIADFRRTYLSGDTNSFETGMGTLLRANDLNWDSDSGLAAVEARLDKVIEETDHVVAVFSRAAKQEHPEKLSVEDQKLLQSFGYIAKYFDQDSGEEKETYTIPATGRSLSHWGARREKDLNLPGGTVLDVISAKNLAIMLASIGIPEAAGPWLTAGLEGTALTELQILIVRGIVQANIDFVWQAGLEAGEKYIKGDKTPIQWERNLLNSFLLGGFQGISGTHSQAYMENFARRMSRTSKSPRLRKYLKQVFAEASATDKAPFNAAKEIYGVITEGLQLLQDTSLAYTYQVYIENQDVGSAAVLEMLLQGTLARVIARAKTGVAEYLASKRTPEHLRAALEIDPRFRKEMIDAIELMIKNEDELFQRFAKVVTRSGTSAETRFHENLVGEFTWVETKALFAGGKISEQTMASIGEQRLNYFEKLIFIARVDAIKEVNENFGKYLEQELVFNGGNAERARERALRRQRRELDAINADLFAPGAKTATSDVDRATQSVYLRKHLVALWDVHARMHNEDAPPVSARAFDVNEYIDVFNFIKGNRAFISDLRSVTFTADTSVGVPGLGYSDAMLAVAMSGAMRTLSVPRMDLYIRNRRELLKNRIEDGVGSDADLQAFDKRARWSKKHLLDSQRKLQEIATKIADGGDPNDPNTLLRAKDQLYQTRMEEINDLQWELAYLEEKGQKNSAAALNKRADIERRLGIAMRDGIETYTHTIGLDIIVNMVQAKKKTVQLADGTMKEVSYKVADRIDDSNFTLKKDLHIYQRPDIEGIIHDQIMFILEHTHAFSMGLEAEYMTGRALGKYVERYFLAEKILGLDIAAVRSLPESDPTRRLLELSQKLSANKSDPEAIVTILRDAARTSPGTPRDGLAEMFYLIEQVVPGMKNLTGIHVAAAKGTDKPALAPVPILDKLADKVIGELVVAAFARERQQQEIIAETGGNQGLARFLEDQSDETERARLFAVRTLEELKTAAKEFRLKDWKQINELERQIEGQTSLISSIPWNFPRSKTVVDFLNERAKTEALLQMLKEQVKNVDIDDLLTNDPEMDEYRRVRNRIWWLEEKRNRLMKARDEAIEAASYEAIFDSIDLGGNWVCGPLAQPVGELHIEHAGTHFNMSMRQAGKTSPILFQGSYLHGLLRGRWWDPGLQGEKLYKDLPPVFAGMSFSAETDETGSKITFKYAPEHPAVDMNLSGLSCERSKLDLAVENTPYIDSVFRALTNDLGDQSSPDTGYLKVILVHPGGEAIDPFFSYTLYDRGELVESVDGWIYPGKYRLAIHLSETVETLPIAVESNKLTEVTVRPGAVDIVEHSADGQVSSHVEVHDAEDPSLQVFTDTGNHPEPTRVILPPGVYTVALHNIGTIEIKNVLVRSGKVTVVDAQWAIANLKTRSGKPFSVSSIARRGATEEGAETLLFLQGELFSKQSNKRLHMPPGRYMIEILVGNGRLRQAVNLTAGEVANVDF